jgi:predicted phosphate transport protein (TIGR00153 family)
MISFGRMNFLPKDEKFFELFEKHAEILCKASKLLVSGLRSGYPGVQQIYEEMASLEDQGDHIIHEIFRRLRATFITPFDPEDIQTLATSLDNVLDTIEDVTFRMVAYRLDPLPGFIPQLAELVDSSTAAVARALSALHQQKPVLESCIEVNRLENQADKIERNTIADLFLNERDPIALIKQKEICELLESATDRCEDVADIIQNVAVKNS